MARNLVFILQGPTNHTKHREYSKSFARDRVGAALFGFRNEAGGLSEFSLAVRSVNGNGTSTISPCLKLVVDGILGIVPEFERRFGRFEPSNIVGLDFQMPRQVLKQTDLLANI
jgi:hypothetical protein